MNGANDTLTSNLFPTFAEQYNTGHYLNLNKENNFQTGGAYKGLTTGLTSDLFWILMILRQQPDI